jgi:hypothetical protein
MYSNGLYIKQLFSSKGQHTITKRMKILTIPTLEGNEDEVSIWRKEKENRIEPWSITKCEQCYRIFI